jgi:hypothetical protein
MRMIPIPLGVAAASMVVLAGVANAEPVRLSASAMDAVTAAAPIQVNIPINIQVQTNTTTQVANAIAVALANCGICSGRAPAASSLAGASNANVSRLLQR